MEPQHDDLNSVMRVRREKLEKIQALGVNAYPHDFNRTHFAADIAQNFDNYFEKEVSVAGRLMSLRKQGKATFAHVEDSSGRIQIYVKFDAVGEKGYELFGLLDLGDIIGVTGKVLKTRTGEITIQVTAFELLSKTLRPLPIAKEKVDEGERVVYDAFADKEMRYRQRYADLAVNPEVREVFKKRSRIVASMREYLTGCGYLEVETPILQPLYGGASARPFTTHHNTLDMTLYLRIANELYLKRLIVGGYDGVFEFAKDFRNEGMDRFHNPEFTMMEVYIAYHDYHFMMNLVEEMFCKIVKDLTGGYKITFQNHEIDFTPPWTRLSLLESIEKETGYNLYGKPLNELKEIAKKLHVEIDNTMGVGKIIDEIFGAKVEAKLIQPVFITDHPVELSPLAKKHRMKPGLVERFEPFIGGKEMGNAFTELNDPIDQRERFLEQKKLAEGGDEEAQQLDEDFLRALEYGMPPTTGLGVGIDRLVMLLTNQPSIRDVLLFPQMRAELNFKPVVDLFKDKNYLDQESPVRMFVHNADKYIGLKIASYVENQDDPPDYFLKVENTPVNLEVTNLVGEQLIFSENPKFDFIESVGKKYLEKHKHLLSPGVYQVQYYPGDKEVNLENGLVIPTPDFSAAIKKIEQDALEKQLDEGIFKIFSTFNERDDNGFFIENKKGQRVGKVSVIRFVKKDNEVQCNWVPQAVSQLPSSWNLDKLKGAIQNAIDEKEKRYSKETSKLKQYPGQRWLLISDIHDHMGTSDLSFDISDLVVNASIFERVFLIRDIQSEYRISEMQKIKE